MSNQSIHCSAIGLMSGSSLDGLDAALTTFVFEHNTWSYKVVSARTFKYPEVLHERLAMSMDLSAEDLCVLDADLGKFCGEKVRELSIESGKQPDLVASHGHTVFHQPGKGFTTQIGHPAQIAAVGGFPVIADFRSGDVALGGQGAPLVPIGDELLFGGFDYCLNLGGIANVSYRENDRRLAFDISPANLPLNFLAKQKGLDFDENGALAESGQVNSALLAELEKLDFYNLPAPKSLGREWLDHSFLPLLNRVQCSLEDKLATVAEHVAIQVGKNLPGAGKRCLVTGGGAYNSDLMRRIKSYSEAEIVVPADEVVQFKEALIFAFLGVLRWHSKVNVFSSVTGASRDHSSGCIYL